jgi:hypothetical protein
VRIRQRNRKQGSNKRRRIHLHNPPPHLVPHLSFDADSDSNGSVTVGDDTIVVAESQAGNVDSIKTELESLSTVGTVTVTVDSVVNTGCVWKVTFDTNADAGGIAMTSADTVPTQADSTGIADANTGNAVGLSGEFTIEFDGQRTGYLPYSASAGDVEDALDQLSTIGDVDVSEVRKAKAEK